MSEPKPENEQPPRTIGRPRADDPLSAPVTAWVRPSEYDRLVKMANQRDQSVSALVRSLLIVTLR